MSGGWWQFRPEHCECTIEVVEVESDGTVLRGCVDDDCRCTVCGCEALWEDAAIHGPCCDTCTEPLCVVCRVPMEQCYAPGVEA